MKIGIPRALLYYRFRCLWKTFFETLGHEIVLSPPTNKRIMDAGNKFSIDENCLSSKLYFGHIAELENKCDVVFVPRIANYSTEGVMCTRFEALYDMSRNTFREYNLKFITCNVDILQNAPEKEAYVNLGMSLGASKADAENAYAKAREAHIEAIENHIQTHRDLLDDPRIKILLLGHSYNLFDEYIGKPVIKGIEALGAIPIPADAVRPSEARQLSTDICKSVPWIMNRELLGAIAKYRNDVSGIVLITAFPCGPDSMLNEMIIRRVKDIPILTLTLDSQDGTAGIETRLESFVDIIRFRKEMKL